MPPPFFYKTLNTESKDIMANPEKPGEDYLRKFLIKQVKTRHPYEVETVPQWIQLGFVVPCDSDTAGKLLQELDAALYELLGHDKFAAACIETHISLDEITQ